MTKEAQVQKMTETMAKFVGYTGKVLPDDVIAKLEELRAKEDSPMATVAWPRDGLPSPKPSATKTFR